MAHPRSASSHPPLPPMTVLFLSLATVLDLLVVLFLAFMFELLSFLSMTGRRPAPPPLIPPSTDPVCPHLHGHRSRRSSRSCVSRHSRCPSSSAAAAAVERPTLLLFLLHGWNGSVDRSLLRARSRSQKKYATTLRRQKKLVNRRQHCDRTHGITWHYGLVVHLGSATDKYIWH